MNLRILRPIVPVVLIMVALSACGTTRGKDGAGASLSLLPAAKPSPSATYIKALDGGIVGRTGVKLGDSDQQRALEAEYRALEAAPGGQPVVWSGRGVSGQVVAAAPYQVGSQNCRQYTHTVTVDGTPTQARGAACRNPDGTWTPLN